MLGCRRFKGKHTAGNINEAFMELLAFYGISAKVTDVVSDSAANMMKAFSDFGLPGFQEDKDDHEDYDEWSDDEITSDNEDDHMDEEIYDFLKGHHKCFAHVLQLVVKDGLKGSGAMLSRVLGKASKLVSFARKSTIAADVLEGQKRLQTASETRWNSQLIMLRSVLAVPARDLERIDGLNPALLPSAYERNIMQEMCDMLVPFEEVTKMAQKQESISSSLVVPCIRGLMRKVDTLTATYNGGLMQRLQTAAKDRLQPFEEESVFRMAAFLDPCFKLRWVRDSEEKAAMVMMAASAAQKFAPDGEVTVVQEPANLELPTKRQRMESDLFDFMEEEEAVIPATRDTAREEIMKYLASPCLPRTCDPLLFWVQQRVTYPRLARLSLRYLCVPASSAAVERIFSIAGNICKPNRSSLTDTTFERLLYIRCNRHLFGWNLGISKCSFHGSETYSYLRDSRFKFS